MGHFIGLLDRVFNREAMSGAARRAAGAAAIAVIVFVVAGIGYAIERLLIPWPLGTLTLAILASSLIAQRSLYDHVGRVADALEQESLPAAPSRPVSRTHAWQPIGRCAPTNQPLSVGYREGARGGMFGFALPGALILAGIDVAEPIRGTGRRV